MEGWDLSCLDWQARLRDGRSLIPELPHVDLARKAQAIQLFNQLRIPDIPGTPQFKTAAGDWAREIVGTMHGSIIGERRMIREALVLVPKKNAKTTMGAGMTLAEFLLNKRPMAEFILVGATQAIAGLAFKQIAGMIALNPYLRGRPGEKGRLRAQSNIKTITDSETGSTLQIKSFDADVLTGVKPTFILLDELHLMSDDGHAPDVIGQIRGGMVSQAEAALIFITTQSFKEPAGAFLSELTKARDIRDGLDRHTRMLPVLYEFPDDIAVSPEGTEEGHEPWRDTRVWHMVTPNAGRSITIERLAEDFLTAERTGAQEVQRWASQHLNIQIGLALRSSGWNGAKYWARAATETSLTVADLARRCDVLAAGIDGGGMDDLLGLAIIGREIETRRWLVLTHAWAHQDVLKDRKTIAGRLVDFAGDGDLTIVGDIDDAHSGVADMVAEAHKTGLLVGVGLDPLGVGSIVDRLAERGVSGDDMIIGISQGFRLQGATKTVANKLASRTMAHAGRPLMNWSVGNAKVEKRGNAILITKQASGTAKIDPLMALFDAASIMSTNPESKLSVYETRGIRVVDI